MPPVLSELHKKKSAAFLTWWDLKGEKRRTLSIRSRIDLAQALRKEEQVEWKRGSARDDEGGMVQCDEAQMLSYKKTIIIYPFTIWLNPFYHLFIVPSPPEYHPLILLIRILVNSLHHSVIDRHREVKVKQADTGGWVKLLASVNKMCLKFWFTEQVMDHLCEKKRTVFSFYFYLHSFIEDVLKHVKLSKLT